MNRYIKGILFALLIAYVVSPVDLAPGPVDDILTIILYFAANKCRFALEKPSDEHIDVIDTSGTEL